MSSLSEKINSCRQRFLPHAPEYFEKCVRGDLAQDPGPLPQVPAIKENNDKESSSEKPASSAQGNALTEAPGRVQRALENRKKALDGIF